MSKLTAYGAYQAYMAVKTHFTSEKYDYFKYQGKVKSVTEQNFMKRNDRFMFSKLAKDHDSETIVRFLSINFYRNPKLWIGNLVGKDVQPVYRYDEEMFRSELSGITMEDFKGSMPSILGKDLKPETLILLSRILELDEKWKGNLLWEMKRPALTKYGPFADLPVHLQTFFEIFKHEMKKVLDTESVMA